MIAVFAVSLIANVLLAVALVLITRPEKPIVKPEPVISEISKQIIQSLADEPGWQFRPATREFKAYWFNNNLKNNLGYLHFTLSSWAGRAQIYRWSEPDKIHLVQYLNDDEVAAMNNAIKQRELSEIMSQRIDMIDKQIHKAEVQKVSA